MKPLNIFLSGSVPPPEPIGYGESNYALDIREALIGLSEIVARDGHRLVFGGHPSFTKIIGCVLGRFADEAKERFLLYQMKAYEHAFPPEVSNFVLTVVDEIEGKKARNLNHFQTTMIRDSVDRFDVAVFLGGARNVYKEFLFFREFHRFAPILAFAQTGGTARELLEKELMDMRLPGRTVMRLMSCRAYKSFMEECFHQLQFPGQKKKVDITRERAR